MTIKHKISPDEILKLPDYEAVRDEHRRAIGALKKSRRLAVGPHATFFFECYDTMWYQVHEMLRAERGGEAQLADELEAYNPLIPNGQELVATVMFEINVAAERARVLSAIGGVEDAMAIEIEGLPPAVCVPEDDTERTRADGKASSVQFVHFPFSAEQIAAFKDLARRVTVVINHPNYGHLAILPDEMRKLLAGDFG